LKNTSIYFLGIWETDYPCWSPQAPWFNGQLLELHAPYSVLPPPHQAHELPSISKSLG
jgi:hypothetical protein